ncbi:hypothetical protein HHL21_12285 [Massilia sp. RP-1-19]|uniref:Uncharacterized protein n=1 Tax=Massilia polaris TaxID=2728846 RepID=A0A848HNY0_9BURK|nr:hypothetical protein [Massilia polaris]NML61839.1 hypothetical protein [Massilia polaris]
MSAADFRLIRPVAITDTTLTSCTVPEAIVAIYVAGTTYAAGDIRGVATGTSQIVYQSLQAANLGHTPASSPTWWKVLGTVYAAYAGGTTYALNDIVSDLAAHKLYKSLAGGNLGNALTDATKWLPLGSTTRWKMFDKAVNSQTTAPDTFSTVVTLGELANTLTLINVEAATVTVEQSVSGYSRTKSLVKHDVLNWYDFYYEEPIRSGDVVFDDIPPYAASTLTVTADNTGGTAAIGCCFFGKSRTIGQTQWELTGGILSYSTTSTDTLGNTTMVKRANAKHLNFDVKIPDGFESEAFRLLTLYTDVEIVVIGSTDYSMTISYGFLDQWSVPISNSGKTAPISFRGLI